MPITSDELTKRLKDRLPLFYDLRQTSIALLAMKEDIVKKRKMDKLEKK